MKELELIKKLDYAFSDNHTNQNVGPYKFVLGTDARKILDEVKQYLQEASGHKKCIHCLGHGAFGFSIPLTGEVGRHKCPKCNGSGWVDKYKIVKEVTPDELDEYKRKVIKEYHR